MSIQVVIEDLLTRGGDARGFIAVRVREKLESVAESTRIEEGAAFLESLLERVRVYSLQLCALEVPTHEFGRHHRLLTAFEVYEEALSAFLSALEDGEVDYDPQLVDDLCWADAVVREHQEYSTENQSVDALF